MANQVLSQQEADNLLRELFGDDSPSSPSENKQQGGVQTYNLGSHERIVRGRMPTMEVINERFARLFRINLFNLMRRTPEIEVGVVTPMKFSEFIKNLHVPTNFNLIQIKPLRGTGLLIIDPSLVFLIIDNMFGGDGRFHSRVEGREFTTTEYRIIAQVIDVIFESYEKSWESIYKIKMEYTRSEINPQFVNIATPNELVVTTKFGVDLPLPGGGNGGGSIYFCLPYSMIEPIREILYSSMQGDHLVSDKRWLNLLSQQIKDAEIEVTALYAEAKITLRDVIHMRDGDIISVDAPENTQLNIDGVPIFEGQYGQYNNHYAIEIKNTIKQNIQELISTQK